MVFRLGLPDSVGSPVNRLVRLRFAGSAAGLGWVAGFLENFMAGHPVDLVVGTRLDSAAGTSAALAAATLASTPASDSNESVAIRGWWSQGESNP